MYIDENSNFIGAVGKALFTTKEGRKNRKAKRETKLLKKKAQVEIKNAKADSLKADSLVKASQATLLSGANEGEATTKPKSNKGYFIAGGIVLFLIILSVVIILIIRKS